MFPWDFWGVFLTGFFAGSSTSGIMLSLHFRAEWKKFRQIMGWKN